MTDRQVADFLKSLSKAGGELTVAPHDWLNPGNGYYAKVRLPSGNAQGYTEHTISADSGLDSVIKMAKFGPPLPSPIG